MFRFSVFYQSFLKTIWICNPPSPRGFHTWQSWNKPIRMCTPPPPFSWTPPWTFCFGAYLHKPRGRGSKVLSSFSSSVRHALHGFRALWEVHHMCRPGLAQKSPCLAKRARTIGAVNMGFVWGTGECLTCLVRNESRSILWNSPRMFRHLS